ncbi:MAG: hypothetical protein ABIK86_03010 [candidate division WOR-3 bacterium]
MMKVLGVLLAASCWLSVASAQWQVDYVLLPDSMSGARRTSTVLYNPGNNTVFVAGREGAVVVLDGVTSRKVARIPTIGRTGPMCYNPVENKVYVAQNNGNSLLVIDAAANRAIGTVSAPALDLCYNPVMNRVYAVGWDTVTAVACDRDSVVAAIALPSYSEDICCVTRGNKVYCVMSDEDVAVIDCSRDTIIRFFYSGAGPYDMLYNHRSNRVYISEDRDEDVTVVDAVRDVVVRWLPAGYSPDTMCLNTVSNKVYVTDASGDWLTIIDCARDTVLPPIFIGPEHSGITFDSLDNLVYLALTSDSAAVIDGRGDSAVASFRVGRDPAGMCYNARQNLIYVAEQTSSEVGVFRGLTNELVARPRFWCELGNMASRTVADEVWGAVEDQKLAVFSPTLRRVARFIPLNFAVSDLFYVPELDKVYAGSRYEVRDTVLVVHCNRDSVVPVSGIRCWLADLCCVPALNKVYVCAGYDPGVAVLDAAGDTLLRRILPGSVLTALECSRQHNRVFAADPNHGCVRVIDVATDSLVASTSVNNVEQLLYVADHRLLFCLPDYYSPYPAVIAVDPDSNRVIRTIWLESGPNTMVYSSSRNKLYVSLDTCIVVIDVPTLVVRARVPVRLPMIQMAYDTVSERLYGVCRRYPVTKLIVIDGRGDSIVSGPAVDSSFGTMLWDQQRRRLYLSYLNRSMLAVVTDTAHVGLPGEPGLTTRPPTIVRGVLHLEAGGEERKGHGALLDATGRKVMDLQPGANDVRHLAPGVYFVRQEPRYVTKVVLQR